MRAVVTRVNHASVRIEGKIHGQIGKGLLVLLGVHRDDTEKEASKIADKICGLRIFEDEAGKMNLSPDKVGAGLLIISQFTLFADERTVKHSAPKQSVPFRGKRQSLPLSSVLRPRTVWGEGFPYT